MSSDELSGLFATELSARLRSGALSPLEVMDATISRIEAVNPKVNALPTLCLGHAREQARAMTEQWASTDIKGPLWGLPLAVKDYNDLGGVATTYGSPLFADNIAHHSDATVAKLQASGAIAVGKSNVPEWAGAHTFNPVFGHTLNPWNSAVSAGGSSGGSGVALATGMVPLATGNDLGGSLRVPASFNGVVGLRPGPGRVPRGARLPAFDTLWVEGPMGRCVADVALMLDAQAGHNKEDPFSFPAPDRPYVEATEDPGGPKRVAFSRDLGVVRVSEQIAKVSGKAALKLKDAGMEVTDEVPDFGGVLDAFQTLRAVLLGTMMGPLLEENRDRIAPEIVGNVERGFSVTPEALYGPISPSRNPWDSRFTVPYDFSGLPTITLPCGLDNNGMPVSLQFAGHHLSEPLLVGIGDTFERATDFHKLHPPV